MFLQDQEDRKKARIDEATYYWLTSQEFPSIPVVWNGRHTERVREVVLPLFNPIKIEDLGLTLFQMPV